MEKTQQEKEEQETTTQVASKSQDVVHSTTAVKTPKQHQPLLEQPFLAELVDAENVLIAGCGGGYDVFSGLPLFMALHRAGKRVWLASLSFTRNLNIVTGRRLTEQCVEVSADSDRGPGFNMEREIYFPELQLSAWFRSTKNMEVPIYTMPVMGVKPVQKAYEEIVKLHNIDTIILADGGTDSLMRGNESGLGTPKEDMASICAVNELDLPCLKKKYLVCLGFGIDAYHGVNHCLVLENIAYHIKNGGFLGCFSLLPQHQEAQEFIEAYESCLPENSIVCSSVASAIEGKFGNAHRESTKHRTSGSQLFINPLMNLYWCFSLTHIAESIFYLAYLKDTKSSEEVRAAIQNWRDRNLNKGVAKTRQPMTFPH